MTPLHVGQIVSVRPMDDPDDRQERRFVLRHKRGKLCLFETPGLAGFLAQIRAMNPSIQLEGFDLEDLVDDPR